MAPTPLLSFSIATLEHAGFVPERQGHLLYDICARQLTLWVAHEQLPSNQSVVPRSLPVARDYPRLQRGLIKRRCEQRRHRSERSAVKRGVLSFSAFSEAKTEWNDVYQSASKESRVSIVDMALIL